MVEPLDRLRQMVLADPELCRRLLEITDRHEFTLRVAALAREHAVPLDAASIDGELLAARRAWLARWI